MGKKDKKHDEDQNGGNIGTGGSGGAGVTQEQFLDLLNIDLAHEFGAVILYRTYASQVQGQWRMELRQFFEAEIPDELGHAQILADKIVALGGTPATVPSQVKPAKDAVQMLKNALEDEIDTIQRYVTRRRQAEALGHYGLAVEFDDLIRDESTHRDEIQLILKRWDSG
jgi:bacterioferritin